MRKLEKVEYEGLALLGIRVIQTYETETGCPLRSADEIRSRMIYTEDGICLDGNDYYAEDFLLDKLILQDDVPILIVYDTKAEGLNTPHYIDMGDLMAQTIFDLDRLVEKLYQTRE